MLHCTTRMLWFLPGCLAPKRPSGAGNWTTFIGCRNSTSAAKLKSQSFSISFGESPVASKRPVVARSAPAQVLRQQNGPKFFTLRVISPVARSLATRRFEIWRQPFP